MKWLVIRNLFLGFALGFGLWVFIEDLHWVHAPRSVEIIDLAGMLGCALISFMAGLRCKYILYTEELKDIND